MERKKLGYIEARFTIYAPLYYKCIKLYAYDSYKQLKNGKKKEKISTFDFDGYYHYGANMMLGDVIYNKKDNGSYSFILLWYANWE